MWKSKNLDQWISESGCLFQGSCMQPCPKDAALFSELKMSYLSEEKFLVHMCCFGWIFFLMGAGVLGQEIFSFQRPEGKPGCQNVFGVQDRQSSHLRGNWGALTNGIWALPNTFEGWPFQICPSRMPFCSSSNYTCSKEREGKKKTKQMAHNRFLVDSMDWGELVRVNRYFFPIPPQ